LSPSLMQVRSTLTRPNDANAYAQNDLIASSTTAGSIVVPSLALPNSFFAWCMIRRLRLYTTKASGMSTFQALIEMWADIAPTFTNGDNGAYAVATGAANYIGAMTMAVMTQVGDGGYAEGIPNKGSEIGFAGSYPKNIYWSMKEADATGFTPAALQPFTLVAELYGERA
jgi:hypothetical protein